MAKTPYSIYTPPCGYTSRKGSLDFYYYFIVTILKNSATYSGVRGNTRYLSGYRRNFLRCTKPIPSWRTAALWYSEYIIGYTFDIYRKDNLCILSVEWSRANDGDMLKTNSNECKLSMFLSDSSCPLMF